MPDESRSGVQSQSSRADKPGTKLTADAVREIRRAYAAGEAGSRKLARRFGVNRESVRQVLRGDSWAHLEN